jgi:hypothetical protein
MFNRKKKKNGLVSLANRANSGIKGVAKKVNRNRTRAASRQAPGALRGIAQYGYGKGQRRAAREDVSGSKRRRAKYYARGVSNQARGLARATPFAVNSKIASGARRVQKNKVNFV